MSRERDNEALGRGLDDIISGDPRRVEEGWAAIASMIQSTIAMNMRGKSPGPLMSFEDLYGDVCVRIIAGDRFATWPKFKAQGFGAHQVIWRVARFALIDALRMHMGRASTRKRSRGEWDLHIEDPQADGMTRADFINDPRLDPEDAVLTADLRDRFIRSLSRRQKENVLRSLVGVPQVEMARHDGVTESAIYMSLRGAREKLRAMEAA